MTAKEKWILVDKNGKRVAPEPGKTFESEGAAKSAVSSLNESVKQSGVSPKQLLEG